MKRLLSILAAIGLTATASSAVVACATSINVDGKDVDVKDNTATWTETLTFNMHTNFKKQADGTYLFFPRKLHLIADTPANTADGALVQDIFSDGGADGKQQPAQVTYTIKDTSWVTKQGAVYPTPGGYTDDTLPGSPKLDIDGILAQDLTVKATIKITSPDMFSKYAGKTLNILLARVEPTLANGIEGADDNGKYMFTDSKIAIHIPPVEANK